MLKFDEHGHLMPYEIIDLSISEFEHIFVENMPDFECRRKLFDGYLRFIEDIKSDFNSISFQWIAGSFITEKKFPNDLDVVTFLSFDEVASKQAKIHHYSTLGKGKYNIDASFSPICKWNHRFYETSKKLEKDYLKLYGLSRRDENLIKHPKGIIKINYNL
jgi:hypothetical protein